MGTNPSLIYIGHGSRGPNVTSWQVFLKSIGYHCPLSGEYDFQTEQATIRFQRERRVKDESGYVGPRTLAAAGLTFRGDPEPHVPRPTAWARVLESDPEE